MQDNKWVRLLAYITGLVNQRLLLPSEKLATEDRILRSRLPARIRLADAQRCTFAEIGKRLGRKYLAEVACLAKARHDFGVVSEADRERWVRTVKQECLSKLILFGESSLRRALNEFVDHYHEERNHQGKANLFLFPYKCHATTGRTIRCRERLGGLLRYYSRAA